MKMGSRVIVLHDPLEHGVGAIARTQANGEVIVAFEDRDTAFHPDELELEQRWLERMDRPLGIESEKTAA
jgi:hypothetical protein